MRVQGFSPGFVSLHRLLDLGSTFYCKQKYRKEKHPWFLSLWWDLNPHFLIALVLDHAINMRVHRGFVLVGSQCVVWDELDGS
jgi:hypothetical protein